MTNKSKQIGTRWEREATKILSKNAKKVRRIPGSGAIGSVCSEPGLVGDIVLEYAFLNKPIRIEAKYGYGSDSSMAIKREWMEKIRKQAKASRSIPAIVLKFRDVTSGDIESAKWICFSFEDWLELVDYLNDLYSSFE